MRVLWVKSGGFLPLDAGGKIRSFNLARELYRRHNVSVFTFYPAINPDPHDRLSDEFFEAECLPLDIPERASIRDMLAYGANALTSRPYQSFKYCRPQVRRRLAEKLSRERYDVVICDFLMTAGALPWDLAVPTIIFAHNVEAVIWKRHLRLNKNLIWKLVALREYRSVARFERQFTNMADHVLAVSDADRNEFLKFMHPDKVSTIPTGVDLDYFRPQQTFSRNHSLVFIGSMDWKPNQDAILYFAAKIFPLIQKRVPDVTLCVVGKKPSRKILTLKENNPAIQVTGAVEDIRPYVHQSAVYVVPLRIGSGTRIKIFEAMAMGTPVISTNVGAEGLPVEHGRNILLADSPSEFAGRTAELLLQPGLRERIGGEARALVESRYSWAAAAEVLDRVLRHVVQPSPDMAVHT